MSNKCLKYDGAELVMAMKNHFFFFKKTQTDRASKGGSSPKGKRLHSPSPSSSDQQWLSSPYQSKKTTKFELKDNLPVAGNIKKCCVILTRVCSILNNPR